MQSNLSDRAKLAAIEHLRHENGQAKRTLRDIQDALGSHAAKWGPGRADEAETDLRHAGFGQKNKDGTFQLVPGAFGAPSRPEAVAPKPKDPPRPKPAKKTAVKKAAAKPKAGGES